MEKSTKKLVPASQSTLPELMQELASALSGTGPALGFGPITSTILSEQIAVVVATSGSTGAPKEVGLSGSAVLASARASNKFLGAHIGQVWSLLLPLTHMAGVNVLARSLELGTTPLDLRKVTEYPRADFSAIVPTQLFRALENDEKMLVHLIDCKAVLVGGAALSTTLLSRAEEKGINVIPTYGMTETSGGCVYDGMALNGVEIKIENEIVMIKGPVLATTYLNDETNWINSIKDGWFTTSDRGVVTSGKLEILGRVDDIINSGGEKLSLSLVEEALSIEYPNIQLAAFSVKQHEWVEALHVAIAGEVPITDDEISAFLNDAIGPIAKPKRIIRINSLPLTELGKVDRNKLKALVPTEEKGESL